MPLGVKSGISFQSSHLLVDGDPVGALAVGYV